MTASSLLDDALADADRQIFETERRRERQVHRLRDLDLERVMNR
jgi:hypothetical protein